MTHPRIIPLHCLVRADAVFDYRQLRTHENMSSTYIVQKEISYLGLILYVKLYSVNSIHIVCNKYVRSLSLAREIYAKGFEKNSFHPLG